VLDPEHPFTEDEYFAFCMANSTLRIERTAQGEIEGTAAEFLRLVPDFVAELMSPSDRLPIARAKMEEWIANGVALGWLIGRRADRLRLPDWQGDGKTDRRDKPAGRWTDCGLRAGPDRHLGGPLSTSKHTAP